MGVNLSKTEDPRFWKRWVDSGAVFLTKEERTSLKKATACLGFARDLIDDNTDCIDYIRGCVSEANAELKYIGTSEEELSRLLITGYIVRAKRWLGLVRNLTSNRADCIEYIHEYIGKTDAELKYIGTSEEELSQLLIAGYIAGAKNWLELARELICDHTDDIYYIREYVGKANIKLEDIGTSEEELKQLLKK